LNVDLEELLDALPVLINVISADLRYAYVNRPFEELHPGGRERIIGGRLQDLLGEGYATLLPHIEKALAGERVRFEVDLDGPDGQVNTFRTTYVPRTLEDGTVNGFISHSQNVTARKRAERENRRYEEKLQTLQRLESLAALAGGVAHDFNNLLVAMLANAQLAREALGDEHPVAGEIEQIEVAARRAAELSKQMLAYSGKGRLHEVQVNLSTLAREMVGLLRAAMGPGVDLEVRLSEPLPPTIGDEMQLRQILLNLLTNAAEAVGDAGKVSLRTGMATLSTEGLAAGYVDDGLEPGDYIYVEVGDDGVGMDDETLSRIFDPFFTTKFAGRGLGLAACLGIVRAHRGAAFVHSAPGEGTTFRICLPVSDAVAIEAPPAPTARRRVPGNGRILIVDDDARVRRVAERILTRQGYEVATAENGRVALDLLEKDSADFAAMLLDLTMPVMGGVETLRAARAAGIDVPVVICSGYGEDHVRGHFDGLEVDGVVDKPFDIDALLEALRVAIR
jgi:PAS domain S-box-containing protein